MSGHARRTDLIGNVLAAAERLEATSEVGS
jgi:hypothetical protein